MPQNQYIYRDREDDDFLGVVYARTEEEAEELIIGWLVDVVGHSKKMAKKYYNEEIRLMDTMELNKRKCDSCGVNDAGVNLCKEC